MKRILPLAILAMATMFQTSASAAPSDGDMGFAPDDAQLQAEADLRAQGGTPVNGNSGQGGGVNDTPIMDDAYATRNNQRQVTDGGGRRINTWLAEDYYVAPSDNSRTFGSQSIYGGQTGTKQKATRFMLEDAGLGAGQGLLAPNSVSSKSMKDRYSFGFPAPKGLTQAGSRYGGAFSLPPTGTGSVKLNITNTGFN